MCGRYALGIRASFVRYQLQQQGLPVDEAPDDDEARETYNFPPGAYGLVYRADVPDQGVRDEAEVEAEAEGDAEGERHVDHNDNDTSTSTSLTTPTPDKKYKYQIKVMKWGLIPFWTKRSPDYSSMLRTINCRDDSLAEPRGMWNTMKQRKRCIVVAQGFYEWLKKGPNSKDKIPHFVKRKDGNLMCFAGLWDCVRYEDDNNDDNNDKKKEGSKEKLYTYTIITTDSNKQLSFLHDRMPVILDPNSDEMKLWLNPAKNKWTKELQAMLKPFDGELECYPVDKDVGKVGNNSASFIVPVDSKENKKNIANFFGNAANKLQKTTKTTMTTADPDKETKVKKEAGEARDTVDHNGREDNAPLPVPKSQSSVGASVGDKRSAQDDDDDDDQEDLKSGRDPHSVKQIKLSTSPSPAKSFSPTKVSTAKKPRSATSNKDNTLKTSPSKKQEPGTQRITNFFGR